jgi:hypothetical protein
MSKREAQYRGYMIEVQRNGAGWNVWVCPLRPELPIMRTNSFHAPAASNDREAIAEAVQRIEQMLSR